MWMSFHSSIETMKGEKMVSRKFNFLRKNYFTALRAASYCGSSVISGTISL